MGVGRRRLGREGGGRVECGGRGRLVLCALVRGSGGPGVGVGASRGVEGGVGLRGVGVVSEVWGGDTEGRAPVVVSVCASVKRCQ